MNRNILYLLFAIMALSCNPVPKEEPDPDLYAEQPAIPVYTQLLLKGNVSKVTSVHKTVHAVNSMKLIYGFDENRRLIHFSIDDDELGSFVDLQAEWFPAYDNSYAFFVFPDIWQETNETTVMYQEGEDERRFDFRWDETGMFTDVRYYLNGVATAIDGAFDIATRLYDSNGYPCRTFFFQQNVFGIPPGFSYELFFSDFDERGNPLKIFLEYEDWNCTIDRTIEYF